MRRIFFILALMAVVISPPIAAQEDIIGDLIKGDAPKKEEPQKTPKATPTPTPAKAPAKKWIIVIDPGHGGKDTGAIGHRKIREKDIVLQISRRLAKELKKELDAEVYLTRGGDRFITLDERDQIATKKKADVFLSIHANAASRKEANGIEIYYLNNATDEASNRLAARENRGSRKSLSDLKQILSTLIQTESTELSALLAQEIKKSLKSKVTNRYKLERLQIKTALFYVLVGSQAPSVLLEVGFVTNPKEAKRLSQREYQDRLSKAVAQGVAKYFKAMESRKVNL